MPHLANVFNTETSAKSIKVLDEINPSSKTIKKARKNVKKSRESTGKTSPAKASSSKIIDLKHEMPKEPIQYAQDQEMANESPIDFKF